MIGKIATHLYAVELGASVYSVVGTDLIARCIPVAWYKAIYR